MPKFFEGFADQLVVPGGAREIQVFDDELPGFGIRKFESGRASYFVKYAIGAQQRRLTLGKVTRGNLKAMRLEASKVLANARLGHDMVAEKRAAAGKLTGKLGNLIEEFLEDREPHWRPRYYAEVERQLQNDWKPLHKHDVAAIARADVLARIEAIATAQGDIAADRARTALGGLYAWCIERGYVATSPTLNIAPRAGNIARHRVLSEGELAEVWRAAGDDDYGRIVKLLMLTGQRREEIGGLVWYEVNKAERQIELPSERTKNRRPHIVPLSDEALALLPEKREDRELVFGRGEGGFSGWSKAKAEIDGRIAAARSKAGAKKPMQPWRLHDLRRSFVTHINERKIAPPHVVEALVNHVSGHVAGVAGVYNRAAYLDERREALERWAEHVLALVEGRCGTVVPLRATR